MNFVSHLLHPALPLNSRLLCSCSADIQPQIDKESAAQIYVKLTRQPL